MTVVRTVLLAGLVLALPALFVSAADPDKPQGGDAVSYYKDIRPIFQQHCQGCHQPAKRQGGYTMTEHADLLKAGDMKLPNVVPGEPGKSYLIEQLTPQSGKDRAAMPKNKDPLSKDDIEKITKWIAQGAKDDTPPAARAVVDAAHPPEYQLPPVISSLDYSPDGTMLAVSGHHEILL